MTDLIRQYAIADGPFDVTWRAMTGREGDFHGAKAVCVFPHFVEVIMAPVGREFNLDTSFETFILPIALHSQIAIEKTTPNRYTPPETP